MVLLLFVAGLFADPIAKRLLEKQVGEAGDGQYSLQLEKVNLSLLKGNFRLQGIRLQTDTAATGLGPVVEAEALEFSGEGVSWLTFLLEKKLFIDRLYLDGLRLELKARRVSSGKSGEPFSIEQLDIYPYLKEHINKLHLQDLGLNDVDFTLINAGSQDTLHFSAGRFDIHSEDVLVDADKLITSERTFYAAEIDLEGEELKFDREGHAHWKGEVQKLRIFSQEELMGISLDSFVFLQHSGRQRDTLMYIGLPAFTIEELNLRRLEEEETAQVHKIAFKGLDFYHVIDTPSVNTSDGSREKQASPIFDIKHFNVGDFLPRFVNRIVLEELEMGVLTYRQAQSMNVQNLQLSATDIVMDEQPAFAGGRILHASRISSQVKRLELMALEAGYHFHWDSLSLDAAGGQGSLHIANMEFKALESDGATVLKSSRVSGFQLDTFDTRDLDEGSLKLRRLSLREPQLVMQLPFENSGGETSSFAPPNIYLALQGQLQSLKIDLLELQGGSLALTTMAGGHAGALNIPAFNLSIKDLLIDSTSAYASDRVLHSKDIRLGLGRLHLKFPDQPNTLQMVALNLGTAAGYLELRDIKYSNGQAMETPMAKEGLSSVHTKAISLNGLDFQKLLLERYLSIESIQANETAIVLHPLPEEAPSGPEAEKTIAADTGRQSLSMLDLSEILPSYLKSLSINELAISGLSLEQPQRLAMENFYLKASSIHLNGRKAFANNQFLHASSLQTGFDTLWVLGGDPAHEVRTGDFSLVVDEGLGQLSLSCIQINPREKRLDRAWLQAEIPSLEIPHINLRELPEGELSIEQVALNAPKLLAYMPPAKEEEKSQEPRSPAGPDLFPLIAHELKSLKVAAVDLRKGSLRIAGLGGSYFGMDIPMLNVQLRELHIAKNNAFKEGRVLHSRQILVDLEQLTYLFPDRVYFLQVNSANMNTASATISASGLRYMYGETYEKILEGEEKQDVYRLLNDQILMEGVDFQKIFRNEGLQADLVRVHGMDLYIYKDKNMPEAEQVKPMPRDMVLNIGLPLFIKELSMTDADILYEEMVKGAEIAGLVKIDDLSVNIENISNIRDKLEKNSTMNIVGRGRLMEEGYFDSRVEVPMLGDQIVRVRGSIDTLDMAHLNRISRYNSRIAIKSGTLYQARWDFIAGTETSVGDFEVSYEDLKVQLSSKDSPDTTGVMKDVGSFLVNLIVVDSNIAEGENVEPKKVKFEGERDKQKSFFNYYVQSLLAGLMEAIGVPFQ